jgi:hypothetical protein
MSLHIGGLRGLQRAGLELFDCFANGASCAGVDLHISRLQSCERLGSNVPRNQGLYPKFDNLLARLYACTLSGIQVYGVTDSHYRSRLRINDDEKLRPAKAWIHGRLQTFTFRSYC